ncbi:uncharacterized protein VSU04_015233 [Chlamydotis macqueenii]
MTGAAWEGQPQSEWSRRDLEGVKMPYQLEHWNRNRRILGGQVPRVSFAGFEGGRSTLRSGFGRFCAGPVPQRRIAAVFDSGIGTDRGAVLETPLGPVHVALEGAPRPGRPALLMLPDVGHTHASCFAPLFAHPETREVASHFLLVHLDPPGMEVGAPPYPRGTSTPPWSNWPKSSPASSGTSTSPASWASGWAPAPSSWLNLG